MEERVWTYTVVHSKKTSDSLPTLSRGVAVLMTRPQRPAAMCQLQVKDCAKFMLRPHKTRGSLAMSSQVMTGSMLHPRGSAAVCQCRGGSITGSWSIRNDQPRPAHGREGSNIHYGPCDKTSGSLPTLARDVAVLMTRPQRPAATCQWQVKDCAELMIHFTKTRGSLAMSSRVMTGSMMHPRGSAAICQCRDGSITGSWSIRKDQPRPAHGIQGLDIHCCPFKKTSD